MPVLLSAHALQLALVLLASQSGPQTLERPLKAGDSDTYTAKMTMDQQMSMGGAGKQSIASKMEYRYVLSVTKLAGTGRTAQADMTINTTKVEMGGMMANQQVPLPKPIHETGTIDSRNRFQASKADNAIVSSFMGMGGGGPSQSAGLMIELPDHPVKAGDSWGMEVAGFSQLGAGASKLIVTLVGPGQVNGHAVWKVKLSGHFPISVDMNKMLGAMGKSSGQAQSPLTGALASMSMTMDGSMDYSGTGAVDQKKGKTAKLDYSVASDLTMHMSPKQGGAMQPMTMKVTGTTNCTMSLAGY